MTTADRDPQPSGRDGEPSRGSPNPSGPFGVSDVSMRASIYSVFAFGLCFAVVGFAFFGLHAGLGTLIGGVLATVNLWVFARVGQAFVSREGSTAPWGVVAVLKLILLFGGVALILKSGLVSGLSLAAGYAALPFGVTFASLFGPKPSEDVIKRPPGDAPKP